MGACKNISHIQALLIYLNFPTPPRKLKLGLQKLPIGGRLLIASICTNHQKQGAPVISYLLHSTPTGVEALMCFLPTSTNCAKVLGQIHFAEPNSYVFYSFSYNFKLQGHILSTAGVALRAHRPTQPYLGLSTNVYLTSNIT